MWWRYIVTISILSTSSPSEGASWEKFSTRYHESGDGSVVTMYTDWSAKTVADNLVSFVVLEDYKVQPADAPMSKVQRYSIDCANNTYYLSMLVDYEKNMASGAILKKWDGPLKRKGGVISVFPIPANTKIDSLRNFFCKTKDASEDRKKGDPLWDSMLDMTEAKSAATRNVAPLKVSGTAPADPELIRKICANVAVMNSGLSKGAIYALEFLPAVDAASVYGSMGPQGKLIPVKVSAEYGSGERFWTPAYLRKDSFGTYECFKTK